ncbi:MAG: Mfa1 fimbrilin C-terminal domain-containing protein [Bacteroides sp.]|nr:Mfa1 fimbrilin C-terminal domain-containing protein [Bacteroides sp.]
MKTYRYITNLYKSVLALLLTAVFNACLDEDLGGTCPVTGDVKITLTLHVPGIPSASQVTNRAMPEDETRITQMQVLLFKPDDGALVGSYPATSAITTDPEDTSKRSFTVDVIEGTFDVMVLANSQQIIQEADLARDMSRHEVSNRLRLKQPEKFAHNTSNLIPFWGELKGATIVKGGTLEGIAMLRAMAKIDIALSDAVKEDFQLKTVTLYHWQNEMALLPAHYDEDEEKVIAATDTGKGLSTAKATYKAEDGEIVNDTLYSRIYLTETPNPGADEFPQIPCLVVGGEYKGETCYYRVDFFKKDETDERIYYDLLRNYRYELSVTKILGNGSPDEDDAYQSNNIDMEVTFTRWNDGNLSEVDIDGQYQLKVNKASFYFDREPRDKDSFNNSLEIYTNHEDGWQITYVTDPRNNDTLDLDNGWLQIIEEHRRGPKETTTIKLLIEENQTLSPRNAEIHLQVGRLLDFIVKVTQGTDIEPELVVEDLQGNPISELFFYEYYGWDKTHIPQDIRVRWSPKGAAYPCHVEINLSGDRLFEFDDSTDKIIAGDLDNDQGVQQYSIAPKAFTQAEVSQKEGNPFLHRGTRLIFSVTDKIDPTKRVEKTLYLRHQHFAIISKGLLKDSPLDDSYEFSVLSNTTWVLENVEEGIATATSAQGVTGGNDIQSGNPLTYTLPVPVADNTMPAYRQAGRKVTFFLRDQQELIPDLVPFTITATYNDPNSYILNPAGSDTERTVDIPIRKLFWVWDLYAGQPLENITADDLEGGVVWDEVYLNSDLNGTRQTYPIQYQFIPDNSNVLESVLRVTIPPGDVSGNAVVGIKPKGAGDTEWLYSWHLWITGYNPDSGADEDQFIVGTNPENIIMTRNLGALENDPSVMGQSVNGLFYQWGRKDPMHPSFASASSPIVNTANNLGNALNNPRVFYRAPDGLQDWVTNQNNPEYQNGYLWSTRNPEKESHQDNRKGIFDPCPRG